MPIHRVRLRLTAPLGTPLTSGTLFGMLCWALRDAEGEARLMRWLDDEAALWAVSDGMPAGHLPRPVLRPAPQTEDATEADKRKTLKACQYITRKGFLDTRDRLSEAAIRPHLRRLRDQTRQTAHNRIDRLTGSTPDSAGLYFLDEDWGHGAKDAKPAAGDIAPDPAREVYVEAPAADADLIRTLFVQVGDAGYGRDATLGRGRWDGVEVTGDPELSREAGDRRMSLSHGAADGLRDLRCRLVTHYGKLGPMLAAGAGVSPFKHPLLLTRPGATFAATDRPGAILRGVHPERPEVIHNALHLALAFRDAS